MTLFEIKNRFDDSVIFALKCESLKICVEAAIKSEADLFGADLSKANLYRADLSEADLSEANLYRANLSEANLSEANLSEANLSRANLSGANLSRANLSGANLSEANLSEANLSGADLYRAYLSRANLSEANLSRAYLSRANLSGANLSEANLSEANLSEANLSGANLSEANLSGANLSEANLSGARNLIKIMGVESGNFYWKRFKNGLCNNGYQFKVGLNQLREGEVFASDERIICSHPGFHFASRSWCAVNYPERPLEAKIRIPENAKINEPWSTDGKASADMIEIIQVFDAKTGKDVTDKYR